MTYVPAEDRYDHMPYRRCGRSGLKLPAISLGLWHNFGDDRPIDTQRAILRRAFDLGITHFDLANNYGPPYGSAETNFGRLLAEDLRPGATSWSSRPRRATTCGPARTASGARASTCWRAWTRACSGWASTTSTSSTRTAWTPTRRWRRRGRPRHRGRQGKALYVGISSYSAQRTEEAIEILRDLGTPLLIHQPSYSLLNRWIEPDLLDVLGREGVGAIVFSPLGQGMLTDRYLDGIPEDSRAAREGSLSKSMLSEENLERVRALNEIAQGRGQTLAQLALAWTLRDPRVTSTLIGASSVAQLEDNVGALDAPGLRRRRAGRDRAVRGGRRDQHLGAVELGLRRCGLAARACFATRRLTASPRGREGAAVGARVVVLCPCAGRNASRILPPAEGARPTFGRAAERSRRAPPPSLPLDAAVSAAQRPRRSADERTR